jgi:predicted outer membrane repeat protein
VTNNNDSGTGSLRWALANANDGDVIDLTGLSGQITLGSQLDIEDVVTIVGPGPSVLAISGGGTTRVFSMEGALSGTGAVIISGLTIKDGDVAGPGAGIFFDCDDASANSLVLDNVVITGNTATDLGGGIYFDRCDEGGLGDLVIRNSTISGNSTSSEGGAIWFDEGDALTILNSTISNNTAEDGRGGGILIDDLVGTALIANSTIAANEASQNGGGIALRSGDLTLLQTTISGNTAGGSGDGLYLQGSYVYIESAQPGRDDGVQAQDAGDVTITGTIIAGNGDGSDDIGGDADNTITANYSLLGGIDTDLTVTDGGGNQFGVVNPGLGPLASNGGPTKTMALLPGSPAINAGPSPLPTFPGNEFDQRGPGFLRVADGRVDIGAFEVQPPPPVVITPTFTG